MTREVKAYPGQEAPEVEVLWAGEWCFGTLHEWRPTDDGRWRGWVRFHVRLGSHGFAENRIGIFDQADIREAVHDVPAQPGGSAAAPGVAAP